MKEGFAFKFLMGTSKNPSSHMGRLDWKVGEWEEVEGPVIPCKNGLHCTRENGFGFWVDWGSQAFIVEYAGVTVTNQPGTEEEKIVAQRMRLVKRIPITKAFVRKLAKRLGSKAVLWDVDTAPEMIESIYWSEPNGQVSRIKVGRQIAEAFLKEYAPEYL